MQLRVRKPLAVCTKRAFSCIEFEFDYSHVGVDLKLFFSYVFRYLAQLLGKNRTFDSRKNCVV